MKKVLGVIIIMSLFFSALAKKKDTHNPIFQFIPNQGQFNKNVEFRAEIPGGLLFLENSSFTYHFYDFDLLEQIHHGKYKGDIQTVKLRYHSYKVNFNNANPQPKILPSQRRSNYFNYYLGNEPSKWAKNVPSYEEVKYTDLYPGIDLVLYRHEEDGLKYDLNVAPGADVDQIELNYEGVDDIYLKNGKLYVITSLTENWEEKPEAYQIIDGNQKKVACKYRLEGKTLTYEFPNGYDKNVELIIDPVLIFSSYSGATSDNFGYTATYDKFGFLYSGSSSFNPGYPVTLGAYQSTWAGGGTGGTSGTGTDMAISKWDTTGTTLIFSTYLGGSSDELPHSLVVTDFHELYVMGTTGSINFPVTSGAFDTTFNVANPIIPVIISGVGVNYANGSDIVISKFDSSGSALEASTFLGGTHTDGLNVGANAFNYADEIRGEIDLDKNGKVYVASCTKSIDNPVSTNGFQTTKSSTVDVDGIIYKLNHNLSALEWTNYIGSTADDAAYSIAIDDSNDIYITGGTRSTNFPVSPLAWDTSYGGNNDGFIMHITQNGDSILQSSFYGTAAYDQSYFVELDFMGNAHLFGQTSGPTGELISNANYNDPLGGQFVVKFTPELDSIIWATRFGSGDGNPDISPTAFLVDVCSAIYLSGWGSPINGTLSTTGLDTAGGPIQGTTDGQDFYVMVMSDDANSLLYATFFGGSSMEHVDGGTSRFDRKGKVYQAVCAGCGGLSDFPTYPNPGAVSNTNNSPNCNLAVFKMDFLLPIVISDFDMPTTGCAPFTVTFDNLSLQQSATTFFWNFGDGSTSTQFEPTHTYTSAGVYTVTLVVSDAATCNLGDTLTRDITVLNNTNSTLPDAILCDENGVQIGIPQNNDPNLTISWTPFTYLSDTAVSNPIATPPQTTTYLLIIDNGTCYDTLTQTVVKDTISTTILGDSAVCSVDAPFLLSSITVGNATDYWWSNNANFSDTINTNPTTTSILVTPPDSLNLYYLSVTSALGCVAYDTFQMVVRDLQNPITASFDDPGVGCAPYLVNFVNTTDSLATTTYLWNFGNGNTSTSSNPSFLFPNKGSFPVTLISYDSSICPQSDTFTFFIPVRADSNYSVNHLACFGQETEIGIPADTVPGTTYTWTPITGLSDPSIHNPMVTVTQSANYLLVVQHVCTDSVTDIVQVDSIFANTDSLRIICSDNPVVNLKGNSSGTGSKFVWSTSSNFTDTLNSSISDSILNTTQSNTYQYYYFQSETNQGCKETDSTYVVISDQTITLSPDSFICQRDTLLINAFNNFPPNPMSYYWSPAADIIGAADTSSILVSPLVDTYYYLTAINDSGCSFTDTVLISVSLLNDQTVLATADDDSIILGFSTMLHAIPQSGYNYNWTPNSELSDPTSANTLAEPTQTTTFTVLVSDPENSACAYKNDVTVVVYEINCGEPDIFIPNAFSPNLDGENDIYFIRGKVVEEIDLKIYNRWGELVFETTDIEKGWDGKFNGTDVDPAVFVYHLNVMCIDKRAFAKKGNITVVR